MEFKKKIAAEEMKPATLINLVHIALDTYDDIFSDFDPSPYQIRVLSDDFLKEVQKRYVENKDRTFEVRFSLPNSMRSIKTENIIKKRLKDYFTAQYRHTEHEIERHRKNGGIYLFFGFIMMVINIFLTSYSEQYLYAVKILEILLVPLGWYYIWSGIQKVSEIPKSLREHKKFYDKFRNAVFYFISEEAVVSNISLTATKQAEKPRIVGNKLISE